MGSLGALGLCDVGQLGEYFKVSWLYLLEVPELIDAIWDWSVCLCGKKC